ncbi:MAG: hypothetical protein RLZ98_2566 [Pseudomonadota bacterium]|jgi:formate hydrogenlyase subunit 3/multisubunit Na+/H+ antiporter MnhD subunit
MMLIIWAIIAVLVLLSVVLIYMEHEWGLALGGSTAVILVVSYFAADLVIRSPLVFLLPHGSGSHFDAMALAALILLVLALVAIAYLAGRRSTSRRRR